MENSMVLREAKRLYDLGFGIHWLHRKSKRPVLSGWTTGPRMIWDDLEKSYEKGFNIGVRLGTPSKIENNFLAVIDVDVKSEDEKHRKEAQKKILEVLGSDCNLPEVRSGRGNGSRHYYILTPTPVSPFKAVQSSELVKVSMPSVAPSKKELRLLKRHELESGLRLRPAWEIAVMGEGQQVVLPPSVHPDSGRNYKWEKDFKWSLAKEYNFDMLKKPDADSGVDNSVENVGTTSKPGPVAALENFKLEHVDLSWLPVSEKIKNMILTGEGVEDRSAMLLPVATALNKAGLNQNEILTLLTDKKNYLGQTAYHHAKTNDRARAARWLFRYTLDKVLKTNHAERIFLEPPMEEAVPLTETEIKKESDAFQELYDWKLDLDRTKEGNVRGTLRNVVMILENEVGADMIRRDTFAFRDFYGEGTPWGGKKSAAITDDDVVKIKLWISKHFGCEPNSNIIGEALTILATNNSFDPIIDWLDALPEWDGVSRLDTWLSENFSAKGNPEYLAQVFRKWICAMVLRAYVPGTKFDWMPIFQGKQGFGKSSFGRILCGDDYFLDWLPDLSNKDSALALQGIWATEMGELAQLRKNEIETVKAFITRTVDKVRPPYGERWLEMKRRCVFFGTTNYETYLRDDSGNRRFNPVVVGKLKFKTLRQDREQLFAEAKWLINSGFENATTLELEGEAAIYAKVIQKEKMVSDESTLMAEAIETFYQKELLKDPEERYDFSHLKMIDLFKNDSGPFRVGSPLLNWKYDSRNAQFAAKALKLAGFRKFEMKGLGYWRKE